MDARTHRCANVDSDHFLLVSRIWARISNAKCSLGKKAEKYDYEKMTLPEKQVEYKINLNEYFQELAINSDDSLDSRWNKIILPTYISFKGHLENLVGVNFTICYAYWTVHHLDI